MLKVLECKEVKVYVDKRDPKTGKVSKVPVVGGVGIYFDNVPEGLEFGQDVYVESSTGVIKPGKAHGTRVFYSVKHETFSVTMATQIKRYASGSPVYHNGKLVCVQPKKNGGSKCVSGMKKRDFTDRYRGLAPVVFREMQMLAEEKAMAT